MTILELLKDQPLDPTTDALVREAISRANAELPITEDNDR